MDAQISFQTISLTGQALEPQEFYNMDFWKAYKNPKKKSIPASFRFKLS